MFRTVFRFLASLKLALLLLAVIIVASIMGTIWESNISAEFARRYIYGNIWFDIWLMFLCINLFCVAAIRYPWKPHQTGFVITHAGIIILLIGSMIDRHWGIEGFVQLHRGAAPTEVMELRQQELVVSVAGVPDSAHTSFNVKSMQQSFPVNSPTPEVRIDVVDAHEVEAFQEVTSTSAGAPVIHLRLQGPMMGRQERWLFLGDREDGGLAVFSFEKGNLPTSNGTLSKSSKEELQPRLERYFAFANQKDSTMVVQRIGDSTNASVTLDLDTLTSEPILKLTVFNKDYSLKVLGNEKKDLPLEGLDGWKVCIAGYYPNFSIVDKQISSKNDRPENPAINFDLIGPLVKAAVEYPAAMHDGGNARPDTAVGGNALHILLGDDGKLRYLLNSSKKGELSGEIQQGKEQDVTWIPGTTFTVDEYYPHATSKMTWRPISEGSVDHENFTPGLKCRIRVGQDTMEAWLTQHQLQLHTDEVTGQTTVEQPRETYKVGGKEIGISFANEYRMLPFTVSLLKFSAPRDEGLEESMSFASFESTLSFNGHVDWVQLKPTAKIVEDAMRPEGNPASRDILEGGAVRELYGAIINEDATQLTVEFSDRRTLTIQKSDIADCIRKTRKIYMNSPTSYPSPWWGPWLGTTYKFSQADHRMPADPDYSGVQVLRDPGWMPKWVGCLMICFGIFTMFYLKPYFRMRPKATA